MRWIADEAVAHLREVGEEPDFTGTRYRIDREIGRGGMGIVWEAFDTELQRKVAVKVLPLMEDGLEVVESLAREAQILARLEHPGIVPVHDLGRLADGRIFYAMKLVRGDRLDRHLRETAIPLPERLRLFERICEPVAFAHAREVIHRDLKPANIMIGSFGEVLVLDWGLAHNLGEGSDGAGASDPAVPAGTPGYMAPEQARGDSTLDARADVFALGTILREICGNETPRAVRAIADRATAPDRNSRYADATALSRDVARWLDGQPVEAYRENLFERAGRWLGRHRTLVALVVAYLVMRALVILFFGR